MKRKSKKTKDSENLNGEMSEHCTESRMKTKSMAMVRILHMYNVLNSNHLQKFCDKYMAIALAVEATATLRAVAAGKFLFLG